MFNLYIHELGLVQKYPIITAADGEKIIFFMLVILPTLCEANLSGSTLFSKQDLSGLIMVRIKWEAFWILVRSGSKRFVETKVSTSRHRIKITVKLLNWPLSKIAKIGFQDQLSLNAGQKYCRMLQKRSILQYFRPALSYHLS